jgi:hypothetical protein
MNRRTRFDKAFQARRAGWRPRENMPEIARFYGIVIKVFFRDHPPPHFHAEYAEHRAVYDMRSLKVTEGSLPKTAERLVNEWANLNQAALLQIWDTQEFVELPPLE